MKNLCWIPPLLPSEPSSGFRLNRRKSPSAPSSPDGPSPDPSAVATLATPGHAGTVPCPPRCSSPRYVLCSFCPLRLCPNVPSRGGFPGAPSLTLIIRDEQGAVGAQRRVSERLPHGRAMSTEQGRRICQEKRVTVLLEGPESTELWVEMHVLF